VFDLDIVLCIIAFAMETLLGDLSILLSCSEWFILDVDEILEIVERHS